MRLNLRKNSEGSCEEKSIWISIVLHLKPGSGYVSIGGNVFIDSGWRRNYIREELKMWIVFNSVPQASAIFHRYSCKRIVHTEQDVAVLKILRRIPTKSVGICSLRSRLVGKDEHDGDIASKYDSKRQENFWETALGIRHAREGVHSFIRRSHDKPGNW